MSDNLELILSFIVGLILPRFFCTSFSPNNEWGLCDRVDTDLHRS